MYSELLKTIEALFQDAAVQFWDELNCIVRGELGVAIMSRLYNGITGYFSKAPPKPAEGDEKNEDDVAKTNGKEPEKTEKAEDQVTDPQDVKENDAPEYSSDKKTDEIIEPQKPASLVWRISSGVVGAGTGAVTGAVGYGYGGVKWVAGKSYDAGSAVVSTTVNTTKTVASKVPVPFKKGKDKSD